MEEIPRGVEYTSIKEPIDLESQLNALLSSGIPIHRIARLLNAENYLVETPAKRGAEAVHTFNVQAFLADVKDQEPIALPMQAKSSGAVFVPPDSGAIQCGSGEGSIDERTYIPRTRAFMEICAELSLEYGMIDGQVSEDMYRQEPFTTFAIPSLKKIVLVCNESHNQTFIIYGVEDTREWSVYARMKKSELKQMEPGRSIAVRFPGSLETWKSNIKYLLQQESAPLPEIDRSENTTLSLNELRALGYMTRTNAAKVLDIHSVTFERAATALLVEHPEWGNTALNKNGESQMMYSPELVSKMKQDLEAVPAANDNWLTAVLASKLIGRSRPYIETLAEEYRAEHPEWFQDMWAKSEKGRGRKSEHYSPALIAELQERLNEELPAPAGWETARGLGKELHVNNILISDFANTFRSTNPEWFQGYIAKSKTHAAGSSGNFTMHYHPELVRIIRERFKKI